MVKRNVTIGLQKVKGSSPFPDTSSAVACHLSESYL